MLFFGFGFNPEGSRESRKDFKHWRNIIRLLLSNYLPYQFYKYNGLMRIRNARDKGSSWETLTVIWVINDEDMK